MTNFEAKWQQDCDNYKKMIRDAVRGKVSESDLQRGKVISGLRPYIDVYRREHSIPSDEFLTFEEGKEAINLAIIENNQRLDNIRPDKRNTPMAEEYRQNNRILEEYQRSF